MYGVIVKVLIIQQFPESVHVRSEGWAQEPGEFEDGFMVAEEGLDDPPPPETDLDPSSSGEDCPGFLYRCAECDRVFGDAGGSGGDECSECDQPALQLRRCA